MDKAAEQALLHFQQDLVAHTIGAPWQLFLNSNKIWNNIVKAIYHHVHSRPAKKYGEKKEKFRNVHNDYINWKSIHITVKETLSEGGS